MHYAETCYELCLPKADINTTEFRIEAIIYKYVLSHTKEMKVTVLQDMRLICN
jgi:hypothetical protein